MRLAPVCKFSTLVTSQATETNLETENEPDKLYKIMELELRGHDAAVLKSFAKFAVTAGNHLDVHSKRLVVCGNDTKIVCKGSFFVKS